MNTEQFARYHGISTFLAAAYERGREAAMNWESYKYPSAPSPAEAWFFAGYADVQQERSFS